MGGFPRIVYGSEQQSFETFTTETSPVGIQLTIEDGRTFRFVNNGGLDAVNARVFQQIVPTDNQKVEDLDTISAGVRIITGVDSTVGTFAAQLFTHGYMMIDDVGQLDPIHQIQEHTIDMTVGGTRGEFVLKSPMIDAVAVGEKINYFENPWRDIIITPSTGPTAPVIGVIVVAIAADSFGWVATSGPTRVLDDGGGWVAGEGTMASNAVAGAAEVWVPDADQTSAEIETMPLGVVIMVESTTEKGVIWLRFIE